MNVILLTWLSEQDKWVSYDSGIGLEVQYAKEKEIVDTNLLQKRKLRSSMREGNNPDPKATFQDPRKRCEVTWTRSNGKDLTPQ